MTVDTYTKTGNKATSAAKLDKAIFGLKVTNHDLLKAAYVTHLSNKRVASAETLTRGKVRGGGRKPWRQKGTGRARFGSSRNPIWRGGGIVFGPDGTENYTKKLHTKAKRQSIRQALSLANSRKSVKIIESVDSSKINTSSIHKVLDKLGAHRNVLLVAAEKTPELVKATRNLAEVKLVNAKYLNAYHILNADTVVITKDGLNQVHEWLGGNDA